MSRRQIKQRLRRSRRQEARGAEGLGGRVQPASGAFWNKKGDVKASYALVECKRTDAESITLKKADLRKIFYEGNQTDLLSGLLLEISGDDYVVLVAEDFYELVEESSNARTTPVADLDAGGNMLPTSVSR